MKTYKYTFSNQIITNIIKYLNLVMRAHNKTFEIKKISNNPDNINGETILIIKNATHNYQRIFESLKIYHKS